MPGGARRDAVDHFGLVYKHEPVAAFITFMMDAAALARVTFN
jgi:hypothetical protein